MKQYTVTGMSCAACSARVEKAVAGLSGVDSCSVSLLTNSLAVEGNIAPEAVVAAVQAAGYDASLREEERSGGASYQERLKKNREALEDKESPRLARRLLLSVPLLIILMYFSMGHMMLGFPAPKAFDNMLFSGLFQACLALAVMAVNHDFFGSGVKGLLRGAPNMDSLVALGSGTAFIYSMVELFMMILAQEAGDHHRMMALGDSLYFETAAMIPTLITVGKLLEAKSKGRTTDALKNLMALSPQTATLLKNGQETVVDIEAVQKGDIFVVRPGESIPVDGMIIDGESAVNEAALSGESIPVDKKEGDTVSAATVNGQGFLTCQATRVGQDTTLSQIIQMVSDAAATKAPLGRIADKVSGIFVPVVLGLAFLTCAGWLIAGRSFDFAIARAIAVLVISCPCALGLATPVAIMAGSGVGAKNGILFKTAAALEGIGRSQVIALDKTGTLTKGEPALQESWEAPGVSREELLIKAASLEVKSEHPLARAVLEGAKATGLKPEAVQEFSALPGNGLKARKEGKTLLGGSLRFVEDNIALSEEARGAAEDMAARGLTPLLFAEEDRLLGILAVADSLKEDSILAVEDMRAQGLKTVMLTGDNEITARAVAAKAGVDEMVAGVLPQEKAAVIERLAGSGKVAMVGDGINDAPALVKADIGLAIGAGTDVALDAADVVLMKSSLLDASAAVRLGRATIRNIHENLFWAFIYNLICIPMAMGLFGLELKPIYGAAAMSLSSVCVCLNALRLNRVRLYPAAPQKKSISRRPE